MRTYSVTVFREFLLSVREECTVEIDAPDEATARDLAPDAAMDSNDWFEGHQNIHDQSPMEIARVYDVTPSAEGADLLRMQAILADVFANPSPRGEG